jgi:hypothetical protein
MLVFRKKLLITLIAGTAVLGQLTISAQFGRILDSFPGINISSLLAEELIETAEGESQKEGKVFSGMDIFMLKEFFVLHNFYVSESIAVFFHTSGIPPFPYFDTYTPPPEG